jgi:hypothetical protein
LTRSSQTTAHATMPLASATAVYRCDAAITCTARPVTSHYVVSAVVCHHTLCAQHLCHLCIAAAPSRPCQLERADIVRIRRRQRPRRRAVAGRPQRSVIPTANMQSALVLTHCTGTLYIPGVDDEDDCASERACHWQRHAAVIRSTCSGSDRTSLRVLCTSTLASSLQHPVAPHCVQIVVSPKPSSAPANIELCVRWVALALRESRASNASCLGLLLAYISSMILLTKASSPQHAPQISVLAPLPSDAQHISPGDDVQPPARSLASRCCLHRR